MSGRTWYFVSRVLQTPVRSIMATKMGIRALDDMLMDGWIGLGEAQ